MGAIDSAAPDGPDGAVDGELVRTIEAVEEGDFLVINDDTRTWEVTDVVDRAIEDSTDDCQSKRVCRLSSRYAVFGLELVEYLDCHEATLHVLETNDELEANRTYAVDDVQVLDQQVPWVVVGNGSTYHFPDPHAAAYGEAEPACGVEDADNSFRITRISAVYPAYSGCRNCLRQAKPIELQPVHCPKCNKAICHGMFQEVELAAVDGLSITCPRERCDFDGVVELDLER
ncbi:hypothetical protein [Haloarcula laminariae]|uniref:hypothetical protein n=1 Tax=Haloarcula laminariae TaxID=2961577 RepID=UPI002406D4B3|nr:hypothetical protein [Halomicroarcula sp. FL173]